MVRLTRHFAIPTSSLHQIAKSPNRQIFTSGYRLQAALQPVERPADGFHVGMDFQRKPVEISGLGQTAHLKVAVSRSGQGAEMEGDQVPRANALLRGFLPLLQKVPGDGALVVRLGEGRAEGEGGLAVLRISGRDALAVADRVLVTVGRQVLKPSQAVSHTVHYGHVVRDGRRIDEVLLTVLRAPRTFTREDTAEISCHGGLTCS